jgi:peroxiredoxin/outer membrane protein assembly factor BamB
MRHAALVALVMSILTITAYSQQPPAAKKPAGSAASKPADPRAAAPKPTPPASQKEPPSADEVVRRLADFYKKNKTFKVDVTQKIVIDLNGFNNTMETKAKIAVERPNRVAVRTTSEQLGFDVACDGGQLWVSVPQLKQYTEADAPDSLDEIFANPVLAASGGGKGPLFELFYADPYVTLMQGVTKTEYLGREKIGDVDAHHLKFEQEEVDWELWVAAQNEPRVLKASFDLAKSLRASGLGNEQLKNAKMTSVQQYKNWQFNLELNNEAFSFKPSADAKKVDDFGGGSARGEPERSPLVGQPAPDIEQELLDGSHFSLKEQQDKKIVILDFWATWCGPCVAEMPLVAKVADQYRDKGVALYCLNQAEDAETIRDFLKEKKLKVTVSLDANSEAGNAYGVEGIPMLVLINKAGIVQSVHVGYSPDIDKKLKAELDAILAGKDLAAEAEHAGKAEEGGLTAKGLRSVWSKKGAYSGVALMPDGNTIVALRGKSAEFFDVSGQKSQSVTLSASGKMVRPARLKGANSAELVVFDVWGARLAALNPDGSKLWEETSGQGVDDVWTADLDGDGKDEVIVGYNGATGLHVFGPDGKPRWHDTSIGNVWHVVAGDVNGDGALEVITTSARGSVHVFDKEGKNLATLNPGTYANMVRSFRPDGESADAILVVGGGPQESKMVALTGDGNIRWQATAPQGVKQCNSLSVSPDSKLAAAAAMSGEVWIVDLSTGKIVGAHSVQGSPEVAWAAGDDTPLLIVASASGLTAWRLEVSDAGEPSAEK